MTFLIHSSTYSLIHSLALALAFECIDNVMVCCKSESGRAMRTTTTKYHNYKIPQYKVPCMLNQGIEAQLVTVLPTLAPQGLANVLWALARWQHTPSAAFWSATDTAVRLALTMLR